MKEHMLGEAGFVSPWKLADCAPTTPVLLAFSGGADSVALLHLLACRMKTDGFPLILAHVQHGIRGAEALRDRDFCVSLAEKYGLELCVLDADVPRYAREHGMGLEEAAREVRYDYFARVMREKQIPLLVTAHNADDQLETVLFRLSRGTSLTGLCGIASVRPFADGTLVRPLLPFSKAAIEAYCTEKSLRYVTDSTNSDAAYARNRLRLEVVPVLESLFSGVAERTNGLCERLQEDDACLNEQAEAFLRDANGDSLCIKALRALPAAILRRVIKRWITDTCGTAERLHVEGVLQLLKGCSHEACVALPQEHYACVRLGRLCLTRERPLPFEGYRLPLSLGETAVGDTGIVIRVDEIDCTKKVHNLSIHPHTILTVGFDIIKEDVYWRSRAAGDEILLRGMHRKLRRLYAEAGVSVEMRERIPLLCDGEGILWAPLLGLRDGCSEALTGWRIEVCLPD